MLKAKAMYRGGDIVSAADCDFDSTKKLGINCPFCSEALFLRSGSVRYVARKPGTVPKQQIIRPYFCHYNSGPQTMECERRALSKEGKQRIAQIKAEARNQRLYLYNAYLWQMIADDRNISYQMLNRAYREYGKKRCEAVIVESRKELAETLDSVYTYIDEAVSWLYASPKESTLYKFSSLSEESTKKQMQYFVSNVDRKLHISICFEICDFLTTPTAGYVFAKIIKALLVVGTAIEREVFDVNKMKATSLVFGLVGFIAGTHWLEQIEKYQAKPRNSLMAAKHN